MKSALSVLQRWVELDRQLVRGGVYLAKFAREQGISYATAQRDIRAFRAIGQDVQCDDRPREGEGGFGYHGSAPLFCRNLQASDVPAPPVPRTNVAPSDDDVAVLVETAMNDLEGTTEEGVHAQGELERLAWAVGWSKEQTDNAADWVEVGSMVLNPLRKDKDLCTNVRFKKKKKK